MKKSIRASNKSKRSRGRPKTTGIGTQVVVRMHAVQLAALDDWIASQGEKIGRPEAVRRLLEVVLEGEAVRRLIERGLRK